jgi:hypothetical protein
MRFEAEGPSYSPGASALATLGYGTGAVTVASSTQTFPDGGVWRVEIPSVEGPESLAIALDEATKLEVPLHRISQGSGVTMHTDGEILEMVGMCQEAGVELCLFARPGANWDIGASRDSSGGAVAARARGSVQLGAAIAEVERGASLGVRSFLVADEGVLLSLHQLRERGDLPSDTQFKTSIMSAPTNPASFRLNELIGADTVNVPSDLSIAQLAEIRASNTATIDFYVEAPDNIGGFVRHHEIYEIIRVAAPVYVKFGLRNAPDVYPAGYQLASVIRESTRERVRRARLGLDELARSPFPLEASAPGERRQQTPNRFSLPMLDVH